MILTALLDHPDLEVQAEAARSCAKAVAAFPLSGISFLPVLVYKLKQSVSQAQQGTLHTAAWAMLLSVMHCQGLQALTLAAVLTTRLVLTDFQTLQ